MPESPENADRRGFCQTTDQTTSVLGQADPRPSGPLARRQVDLEEALGDAENGQLGCEPKAEASEGNPEWGRENQSMQSP